MARFPVTEKPVYPALGIMPSFPDQITPIRALLRHDGVSVSMRANWKHHLWIRPRVLALLAFATVIIIGALTLNWIERSRNAQEEYAVYSAYLSEGILNDAHDWSVGPSIQVVIEDSKRVGANLRLWWVYPFDSRVAFDQLQKTTHASFVVSNLFQTRMKPNIHLPRRAKPILASESEIRSADFQKKFPNNLGYIVLSAVGFNRDQTQAVFYIDHFCGLCGGGRYVLMEKSNGTWQVRDERYTWIS